VAAKGRELGCCKLTLEVRADNYPAQRLYEAVGFDNAASYGSAVQVWFLEKRL
jgi:ribosomal protein S18 acetylase RimI-like enzyme